MRGPSPSRSQNLAGFGAIGDLKNGPVEECPVQSRNVKMAAAPTMSAPDQLTPFAYRALNGCSRQNKPFAQRGASGINALYFQALGPVALFVHTTPVAVAHDFGEVASIGRPVLASISFKAALRRAVASAARRSTGR